MIIFVIVILIYNPLTSLKMKNLFFYLITIILISSCNSKQDKELFEITDYFVNSLNTTFETYGMDGLEYQKETSNGYYIVTQMGRLINVKIQKGVDDKVYEELRSDLEKHYKKDTRVNEVYINKGGTIMIDCRD